MLRTEEGNLATFVDCLDKDTAGVCVPVCVWFGNYLSQQLTHEYIQSLGTESSH